MKKILTILLLIACVSLYFCSDTSTGPDNSSLIGKWFAIKYISDYENYYDEHYYHEININPAFDNYYSVAILEITNGEFNIYRNSEGSDYDLIKLEYKKISNDRLILNSPGSANKDTIFCYLKGDSLIIENQVEDEGDLSIDRAYYQNYAGSIPPTSWLTPLQNDSYEPDDSSSLAIPFIVDSSAQNHVITLGDHDWIKFNANRDLSYQIEFNGIIGAHLILYDNDLNIIVPDTYFYHFGLINWECNLSGEYFIKIIGGNAEDSEGYYFITISTISP